MMDKFEIRDKILKALYQEYEKDGYTGRSLTPALAENLRISKNDIEKAVLYLHQRDYVKILSNEVVDIAEKGVDYVEGPSPFTRERNHHNMKIDISGGNVGQVIQGHNISLNGSDFLNRFIQEIQNHPDLDQEKKKSWSKTLLSMSEHPLVTTVLGNILGKVAGP